MKFLYNGNEYEVFIIKKNNKNTYVRVKDGKIVVTTSYFTSKKYILKMLEENKSSIGKMLLKYEKKNNDNNFYLFGDKYDIVIGDYRDIIVDSNNRVIRVASYDNLEHYLRYRAKDIFYDHLVQMYKLFEEDIPFPELKVRKMKSRWGVCNTRRHTVTLNLELMHYRLECLDYVIVHELVHLIVPNHSKEFWSYVSKYCSNWKEMRKELR